LKTRSRPENEKPGNEKLNSKFKAGIFFLNLEMAISWFTLISPLSSK
jgi:hypothetical protein